MKATIEASPKIEDLREPERTILYRQFHSIIKIIVMSGNRLALINNLNELKSKIGFENETNHFHWHVGGSHMWVKQRGHTEIIIIVSILNDHI